MLPSIQCSVRSLPTAIALTLAACAGPAPEREPIDVTSALARLDELASAPSDAQSQAPFDLADGVSIEEAASFALARHPALTAARAQLGVSQALVVEAGLWPDPTVAWNAVDWLVGGTSDDVLTGFSLNWNNPRPGERKARIAQAQAEEQVARAEVLEAEWRLVRDVEAAWMAAAELGARLELAKRRIEAARETEQFLEQARSLGAATELDTASARVDRTELELEAWEVAAHYHDALDALARRMGLTPRGALALQDVARFESRTMSLGAVLDEQRLAARPDVALALALHEVAERELAVAATLRGIAVSYVGSALGVTIPWGSRWGEATLATALARRTAAARAFEAACHEARAEIEAARGAAARSRDVAQAAGERFEPLAERLLELAREARAARSAPADELLAAQRRALAALDLVVRARWNAQRAARQFENALAFRAGATQGNER
jgi:outer membrane protein TolC